MKNLKLLFAIMLLFMVGISSCKDDDEPEENPLISEIVGTWEDEDETAAYTFRSSGSGFVDDYYYPELSEEFEWTIEGETLTMNWDAGDISSVTISIADNVLTVNGEKWYK